MVFVGKTLAQMLEEIGFSNPVKLKFTASREFYCQHAELFNSWKFYDADKSVSYQIELINKVTEEDPENGPHNVL